MTSPEVELAGYLWNDSDGSSPTQARDRETLWVVDVGFHVENRQGRICTSSTKHLNALGGLY